MLKWQIDIFYHLVIIRYYIFNIFDNYRKYYQSIFISIFESVLIVNLFLTTFMLNIQRWNLFVNE